MIKKGYLQISFAWLFAIIVGAFVLFLAIYASGKIINQGNAATDTMTSKELGILLNPLETGFEIGKSNVINIKSETRIYNRCDSTGIFGKQLIRTSKKSFGKWTNTNFEVSFENKYIFSKKTVEGKKFYLFSKPFKFPFKVADLIYLTSADDYYCFINAPENIKNELKYLNQENILINNCSQFSINICFGSAGVSQSCNISVDYNLKTVRKNGKVLYFYSDALMYGAIFSDSDIYECQLKRLMKRTGQLALLYNDKSKVISSAGCSSNLNLLGLNNAAKNLDSSADLSSIGIIAEDIKEKNEIAKCKLW